MCDCQHRESHSALHGRAATVKRNISPFEAGSRFEQMGGAEVGDYAEHRLSDLQELICELLCENQKLRMSLLTQQSAASQRG